MNDDITIGQAKAAQIEILATCACGHEFTVDLDALIALRGRFAPLDLALLQIVWCPKCSKRESRFRAVPAGQKTD